MTRVSSVLETIVCRNLHCTGLLQRKENLHPHKPLVIGRPVIICLVYVRVTSMGMDIFGSLAVSHKADDQIGTGRTLPGRQIDNGKRQAVHGWMESQRRWVQSQHRARIYLP